MDIFGLFGVELVYQPLGLVLPVGLSFVVFQCMSYTIDVYRGALPRKSWLEVTTYIAFFPQVVAGPIVRAADFLPQMDKTPQLPEHAGGIALYRIAMGMFKKLIIADMLAANLIDRVFTKIIPASKSWLVFFATPFRFTTIFQRTPISPLASPHPLASISKRTLTNPICPPIFSSSGAAGTFHWAHG